MGALRVLSCRALRALKFLMPGMKIFNARALKALKFLMPGY